MFFAFVVFIEGGGGADSLADTTSPAECFFSWPVNAKVQKVTGFVLIV